MRAALIDQVTREVTNIIELPDDYDPEDETAYIPPVTLNVQLDPTSKAQIGGFYRNNVWEAPVPPVVVPVLTQATVQEQIDALTALLVTKGTITPTQAASTKTRGPNTP